MFRSVIQRRAGKGSLIAFALLLAVVAATVGAVRPGNASAAAVDTCGYNPAAAPAPGGGTTVFNENTVTRAIQFYGVGLNGHVGVFTNDESGLYIGSGGTPSSAVAGQVYGEAVPPTFGTGSDPAGRPSAPTIYLTDITSDSSATGGDWENGGQPATSGASALYGSWSPTLGTKPVNKNDWSLGPNADAIPATDAFGGVTTAYNEHYGSEVRWDASAGLTAWDPAASAFVGLQAGHTYRVQSITHDVDQNNGFGDVGEVCTTFNIPAPPKVEILKTADAAQVMAGDSIGFTVTVWNNGGQDATGVTLSDPLPTNAGLNWSIDSQGAGWGGTCAIALGSLNCGPVTIPAGTTQGASSFTVHITSGTTAATGGSCPGGSGKVDNTGTVNSTNAGSGQSSATECVGITDLAITKSGAPKNQLLDPNVPWGDITWTIVVTNNGPLDDTNVMVSDTLPAHTTFVSVSSTAGTCTGGALISCSLGTLLVDDSVTITLVTTPDTSYEGPIANTATVSGDVPETTLANNTDSDQVTVTRKHLPPCVSLNVRPKQWMVGALTKVTIKVTANGKAKAGVRVRLVGAGIKLVSKASNKKGMIVLRLKATKKGAVRFTPINNNPCKALVRVGVVPPNPPVTG